MDNISTLRLNKFLDLAENPLTYYVINGIILSAQNILIMRLYCMKTILKDVNIYNFGKGDIVIENGIVTQIGTCVSADSGDTVFMLEGKYAFPGFVDVHVHLREPGFTHKETIATGTRACARGGFTHVCSMPNLNPVPDCFDNLKVQLDAIEKDGVINVIPFGSITVGQMGEALADMDAMASYVAGFSDDGRGVQSEDMMRSAMAKSKALGKIISAHCEDNSLLEGGYIHKGEYAEKNGHKGICSESEWKPIERDIELIKDTKCPYHVCHISAKESVALIREAKAQGVDITCETAPHYLVMNDMMLSDEGRFKMNPPIRSEADRQALIEGICDGTVDMIATDHAPHSREEKSKGLSGSLNGIVGIETSFPVMYTHLVRKGVISLEKLIELMSTNPAARFGFENGIELGKTANLTVFDLDEEYTVDSEEFLSMGKSSPFDGERVYGKCLLTVAKGNVAYKNI